MAKDAQYTIPVAIFLFKRIDTLDRIFGSIRLIKPVKMYLIADGPRNQDELVHTELCRKKAESLIDWNCEIIKDYSKDNRGVFKNIGEGALRLFQKERSAIFLEDDNLPDPSFFRYCEELLHRYETSEDILWITGTNYLGSYNVESSYMFTQHLLPCGWASWSSKFIKYYDAYLKNMILNDRLEYIKDRYISKALFRQQRYLLNLEKTKISLGSKPISWDYQMDFSLKFFNKYGISPRVNLINNIGVDQHSIHGGVSFDNPMTKRFCGIKENQIEFPLLHPQKIEIDQKYERMIGKILLYPNKMRMRIFIVSRVKRILRKLRLLKR